MKLPSTHSEQEKTANELWGQFTRGNEEPFWQQYHKLIVREAQQVQMLSKTPVVEKTPVAIQPRNFHNLALNYRTRLVLAIGTLGLIAGFLVEAFSGGDKDMAPNVLVIMVLLFVLRSLWRFLMFNTSERGLLVIRDIPLRKEVFIWDKIQVIQLYKDQYKTAYIAIWLRSNEQYRFKYKLTEYDHQSFLEVLEQKRVFVENDL
ncbi:hypothetical protein BKI52_21660 [marine bacterium AO1-C]|nr:hypothetical protein BKI52_21660 [marine bacterium AO1-C]